MMRFVVWPFGKIKQILKNTIFFQNGPKVEKVTEKLVLNWIGPFQYETSCKIIELRKSRVNNCSNSYFEITHPNPSSFHSFLFFAFEIRPTTDNFCNG